MFMTVLLIGMVVLFILLGLVGCLLNISSSRAYLTVARVQVLPRHAEIGLDPTNP